jgi:hypothetical protein
MLFCFKISNQHRGKRDREAILACKTQYSLKGAAALVYKAKTNSARIKFKPVYVDNFPLISCLIYRVARIIALFWVPIGPAIGGAAG